MAKGCALSTGYLPRGGLPRNSVDRITDRPDITLAVDRGRKASTQTNKQTKNNSNWIFSETTLPILSRYSGTGKLKSDDMMLVS